MGKLKETGIIWIDESEIYVADKELFTSPSEFLRAVISHIKELVDAFSEAECGWFRVPEYDKYRPRVSNAYMVHRLNSDYKWNLEYEPGRGRREVWLIDFFDNE